MHPVLRQHFTTQLSLSAEQEALVDRCFKPMTAKRNEILVRKDSITRYIYVVIKGCLRIFLIGDDGNEWTRFLIFEGRMGTAFPSFILRQPSAAAVQSLEPSELLVISYEDREILLQTLPGFERLYRMALEMEYIASIQRIESLITLDAKSRYNHLLETNPGFGPIIDRHRVGATCGASQSRQSGGRFF